MTKPAAKEGDQVIALDTHIVMVPAPPGSPVPTPLPHPFAGILDGELGDNVEIEGMAAATVDSTATNQPSHIPMPPGVSFQSPPSNKATITQGSSSVEINGRAAARLGDVAETCNDPSDLEIGVVLGTAATVLIGG
ncbi:MAG: PAAR domain-containing protein [Candidatus Promineifilaceae bacterium]|nr:PAAR domain-containing protein [Candidatus Promineifilaceae bacterium]